jgi:HK97 gp10 family phage protein
MSFDGFDDLAKAVNTLRADAEEAERRLGPALDDAVQKTALRVFKSARQRAPVDTGTLRSSLDFRQDAPGRYIVGTNVEYAKFVETGTSPHVIRADGDGYLKFPGRDGEPIFRKEVQHPGTEPNPFLRPALLEHKSDLSDDIEAAIRDLLDDAFD